MSEIDIGDAQAAGNRKDERGEARQSLPGRAFSQLLQVGALHLQVHLALHFGFNLKPLRNRR